MADLVTLARAQQAPLLAAANATLLASLISAASEVVNNHLRRHVIQASITEVHDGDNDSSLLLDEPDVVSLTTVTIRDSQGVDYDIPVTDFRLDAGAGEIWFKETTTNTANFDYFLRGKKNITITYVAGLAASVGAVPAPLQQAVCEVIIRMLESSSFNPSMYSERLGDYQYQRQVAAAEMDNISKSARGALEYYRNRVL